MDKMENGYREQVSTPYRPRLHMALEIFALFMLATAFIVWLTICQSQYQISTTTTGQVAENIDGNLGQVIDGEQETIIANFGNIEQGPEMPNVDPAESAPQDDKAMDGVDKKDDNPALKRKKDSDILLRKAIEEIIQYNQVHGFPNLEDDEVLTDSDSDDSVLKNLDHNKI